MNLFSVPPGVPFLDAVAAEWLSAAGADPLAASQGLILLPTRRAARALAEAFLRRREGAPMLLPRIGALGGLDEAPLALAGALDLPPSVEPAQRLALLTRFVLAMQGANGAPRQPDGAWKLAVELAALLDEAARAEVPLAGALKNLVPEEYAAHWQRTVTFLEIVTQAWPAWLAENGLMDPAARQVALLDAQAQAWQAAPPPHRVLVAGTTGGIPAVARLLGVVAHMPAGAVLLPGLDTEADEEVWAGLDEAHPQCGLKRLLSALGAVRGDVRPWPVRLDRVVPPARAATLAHALLSAGQIARWRDRHPFPIAGLTRLAAADQQEEAIAIALILRDALERPGARAALVTPDRALAARVSAELGRFGVVADDSAGEPLADTPPAVFLRLLARAVAEALAPVPLLALLKHPFAAAGLRPAQARTAARLLELGCLRGPRPAAGIAGLRRAVDRMTGEEGAAAKDLLARVERCLSPLLRRAASVVAAPAELMAGLIEAAEALAATDAAPGPAMLWAQEEGEALAEKLGSVQAALPVLPDIAPAALPGLLDAVLQGEVVRSRRALRGRAMEQGGEGAEHPRVFIWGLLEARLQSVDVMVLGSLAEGVWPPATDPGPWLSRPMRQAIKLDSPEDRVGQAAHDFVMACCAAPEVALSCPRRRDRAPAVPSRWLVRLRACLQGPLATHPAAAWARQLDQPADGAQPAPAPRPCPPVAVRPRKMRVTEIETWLRDPYAIYAGAILRLHKLDPLDQSADQADYGMLVHDGLKAFLDEAAQGWPADPAERLRAALLLKLRERGVRPALEAWWAPRLARIAGWVAAEEGRRRAGSTPDMIGAELSGTWRLADLDFELRGRADRIERRGDSLAILDYKTGRVPEDGEVKSGLAPQLPLEAAMAADGAFGPAFTAEVGELVYWRLSGGFEPGRERRLFKGDGAEIAHAVQVARDKLPELVRRFDDPTHPYMSQPHPGRAPQYSDYRQLARVAERAVEAEE